MAWLPGVLAAIVSAILIALLLQAARRAPARRDGLRWVEYGREVRLVAVILTVVLASGAVYFVAAAPSQGMLPIGIAAAASTLALVAVMDLEIWCVRIGFDDATVYCHSPWRRSRQIPIAELGVPRFSALAQWWVIPSRSQGSIRIHTYMIGGGALVELAQTQIEEQP